MNLKREASPFNSFTIKLSIEKLIEMFTKIGKAVNKDSCDQDLIAIRCWCKSDKWGNKILSYKVHSLFKDQEQLFGGFLLLNH